jgi:hypothetical protein
LPVTARLSRKFYEQFGDEIAGEFVDWFNAVDSTYQQQLREVNDLNWERFKAEMDSRFAQFRAETDTRFARFEVKISDMKSDLMKWMFIYWSGTIISLGGLMIALARK